MPVRRLYQLALLLVMALALGLRLYQLGAQSLWYDEGVTATVAQRGLSELTQWTAHDIQPPLYYYVVFLWGRLAGWSEWSLRFPSAWWGVLSVPLLAVVAQRLTRRPLAGLLAALLAALHPLLVYYSQEARMYTMLVTLGVLTAYLLLRTLAQTTMKAAPSWLGLTAYILSAVAAVYTHYFAFFLLLALGCAFLLSQPRASLSLRSRSSPFIIFCGVHLAILVLYGAWIATLLGQLGKDASYWQGRLKVWEALNDVLQRFASGETLLPQDRDRVLWSLGFITLLLLGVLVGHAWRSRTLQRPGAHPKWDTPRRTLLYPLCWLLIPVGGVLGLAAFVPKFNARYVMVALPGLILLWSVAIVLLWEGAPTPPAPNDDVPARLPQSLVLRKRTPLRWGGYVTGGVALVLLLFTFGRADYNWFTNAAFTKAQWRELSAYLREQHKPDEAFILVSGHAWPVWEYYAPDLPVLRLPDLEILNVDTILDFANTGPALRRALAGKNGAWLIRWQDEVVDPTGVVPLQLALAGKIRPPYGLFWQLQLHRYRPVHAELISDAPPIDHVVDVNFGHQLLLHGYTVNKQGDLILFWQLAPDAQQPLPDLYLNLRTTTAQGLPYADPPDQRPADYMLPVMRWQPQQWVTGIIPAKVWAGAGAAPGDYRLYLGVYDPAGDLAGLDRLDDHGVALGKTLLIDLTLRAPTAAPVPEAFHGAPVAPGLAVTLAPAVTTVEPGEPLAATLQWALTEQPIERVEFVLQWRNQQTGLLYPDRSLPLDGIVPMTEWSTPQWLRQEVRLRAPVTAPPGAYWVELAPRRDDLAVDSAGQAPARVAVTIAPSTRTFTPPPLALPLHAAFHAPPTTADEAQALVRLLGLKDPLATAVDLNATLPLTLVWQAATDLAEAGVDYSVTAQLLDGTGRPATQSDQLVAGGTASWLADQVTEQRLDLPTPPEPGRYQLVIALYRTDLPGAPRLLTAQGKNALVVGAVTVGDVPVTR